MTATGGDAIEAFLAAAGWAGAARRLLAADASFRHYDRVTLGEARAVLMVAPPSKESVAPFLRVAARLIDMGFSAPRPLHVDEASGLLLLEDFGDRTFTRALAEGAAEAALYELAIDTLIALHRSWRAGAQDRADLPLYDEDRLLGEAALLTGYFLPAVRGRDTPSTLTDTYLEAWRAVLPGARGVPETLVLRDYHVDNLMLLEGREGIAACGLLDFQDAVLGPVSYDVVSLLEDARRDVSPATVEAMLTRYLDAFPDLNRTAFRDSYAVLGAQRTAKIIGIFTRLARRDGKAAYLRHMPRLWRLLEAGLKAPVLAPVAAWFEREIPAEERIVPS